MFHFHDVRHDLLNVEQHFFSRILGRKFKREDSYRVTISCQILSCSVHETKTIVMQRTYFTEYVKSSPDNLTRIIIYAQRLYNWQNPSFDPRDESLPSPWTVAW